MNRQELLSLMHSGKQTPATHPALDPAPDEVHSILNKHPDLIDEWQGLHRDRNVVDNGREFVFVWHTSNAAERIQARALVDAGHIDLSPEQELMIKPELTAPAAISATTEIAEKHDEIAEDIGRAENAERALKVAEARLAQASADAYADEYRARQQAREAFEIAQGTLERRREELKALNDKRDTAARREKERAFEAKIAERLAPAIAAYNEKIRGAFEAFWRDIADGELLQELSNAAPDNSSFLPYVDTGNSTAVSVASVASPGASLADVSRAVESQIGTQDATASSERLKELLTLKSVVRLEYRIDRALSGTFEGRRLVGKIERIRR